MTTQTDDQIQAVVLGLLVEPIPDPEKARRILAYMAQYKISRERLASALDLTLQQVNTTLANLQARGGTVTGTAEPQAGNTGLIVAALVGAFLLLS